MREVRQRIQTRWTRAVCNGLVHVVDRQPHEVSQRALHVFHATNIIEPHIGLLHGI